MARKFGFDEEGDGAPSHLYETPHWFACYTRARHEKRVTEQLGERGFETYLPVLVKERQWSDRVKRVEFPLFPGYVFTRFTLTELHQVLTVPGVATVIRHNGVPSPIEEGDLENVRRFVGALQETGEVPDLQPLSPGQAVRVMHGPFAGVEGVVVERRGRRRVLVGLKTIGQGMEIDVDGGSLEPLRLAS
jgi:transcription antitermination factor NusG